MHREESPFEYQDHWLGKRRDGRSADTWQIFWRDGRTFASKSTGCRTAELEQAKSKLIGFVLAKNGKNVGQAPDEAIVFNLFKNYWLEHGQNVVSPAQIASSLRVFIGFLMQDKATGPLCTVDKLTPDVFERFQAWRMREHKWEVVWFGKLFKHTASPVNGESISRNLDDVAAALRHNRKLGRILHDVYVPPVPKQLRSKPRDRVLTMEQLGAIFGYAQDHSLSFYAWCALMLATAVRPEAAMQFNPELQVQGGAIDLHPPHWPKTKKVNPVVPAIPELMPLLAAWPAAQVNSRKTAWRNMRTKLGLPKDVYPKTIRHTVATMLLEKAMSDAWELEPMHIEALLGHRVIAKTSSIYAKWNVRFLDPVIPALSKLWTDVHEAARG